MYALSEYVQLNNSKAVATDRPCGCYCHARHLLGARTLCVSCVPPPASSSPVHLPLVSSAGLRQLVVLLSKIQAKKDVAKNSHKPPCNQRRPTKSKVHLPCFWPTLLLFSWPKAPQAREVPFSPISIPVSD